MKPKYHFPLLLLLALLLVSIEANAVPAFARYKHLQCSACHVAFPALNKTGRLFKTNGYRFQSPESTDRDSDFSGEVSQFPMAAAIISRPYTKDDPGNAEIRAIHELELFAGGILYKKLSGFIEVESEGEDGFGGVLGLAALNYDFNKSFHLQLAFAPTFFADPYDTLSSSRRLTAAHYNILNDKFGLADNGDKLRHSRQQVSVFGHVADDKLYYNVGVGGLTGDNVANESTVGFARVAYEFMPNLMVGAFDLSGTCKASSTSDFVENCGTDVAGNPALSDRSFSRYGLDSQIDIGLLRLTAVYLSAKDDFVNRGGSETNNDAYVQATYFGDWGGRRIVPLLRYQTSEVNDGRDQTDRYLVGVTYYVDENLKASLEYADDVSTPDGVDGSSNITLQVMAAF